MTIPFDYNEFLADYPEFVGYLTQSRVTKIFTFEACVLGQVVSACFCKDDVKYYWICQVLAHLLSCQMVGLPGRPSSVSEGSDSASFEFNAPEWAQWWVQTPYGQSVYQCMMTYLAGGHYVSNGEEPYLGNSMNGADALGWVQT